MVYRSPYLNSGSAGFALNALSRQLKANLKVTIALAFFQSNYFFSLPPICGPIFLTFNICNASHDRILGINPLLFFECDLLDFSAFKSLCLQVLIEKISSTEITTESAERPVLLRLENPHIHNLGWEGQVAHFQWCGWVCKIGRDHTHKAARGLITEGNRIWFFFPDFSGLCL